MWSQIARLPQRHRAVLVLRYYDESDFLTQELTVDGRDVPMPRRPHGVVTGRRPPGGG
jgi:hypothetical protein